MTIYPDLEALSRAAAELVAEHAAAAVDARGRFALVLAGGGTPERLYRLLARDDGDRVPWGATHVFWGDERWVPPDHEASNYGMAREALLRHVPLPPEQVHPVVSAVAVQTSTPERAAGAYDALLRRAFEGGPPAFDLVLLGLGEDGHTASLFPDGAPWEEPGGPPWVRAVTGPPGRPPRRRVTLTLAALNAARHACFLVAGGAKHDALRAVLDERPESARLPAAHVRPPGGVTWLVDAAAATA